VRGSADDFKAIRPWRGSKASAWEELCYQLRDPTPDGARLRKTGNPDGGFEWYVTYRNGRVAGWQAKYSDNVDTLISLMKGSLETAVATPGLKRMTFCIPIDLSDAAPTSRRMGGWEKFDAAKERWSAEIEGAEKVKIELWQAGDVLERLNRPANRGKHYFFFDHEVFDEAWCERRLKKAIDLAGPRYTPDAHVDLPIAGVLDGLGRDPAFASRFAKLTRNIASQRPVLSEQSRGLNVHRELANARKEFAAWASAVGEVDLQIAPLPRKELIKHLGMLDAALEAATPRRLKRGDAPEQLRFRADILRSDLNDMSSAVYRLTTLLESLEAQAFEQRVVLVLGEAGQGKTHLFCDAGERALGRKQPAAVVLAGQLDAGNFWDSLADYLALPHSGAEELLGAMEAAGEAAGSPFLLLIDALNEAGEYDRWQQTLPGLIAELSDRPWIALGLSVRIGFEPFVLPDDQLDGRAVKIFHPGFSGHEPEAIERYFDRSNLTQPRVPLLTPEFASPLFLKLYCESLEDGDTDPELGHEHLTAIFDRFITGRSRRITKALGLDPHADVPRRALTGFARGLAEGETETLARDEAVALIDGFAPGRTVWTQTLFAQLLSEGVLAQDAHYVRGEDGETDHKEFVVRFAYQRLADHLIVRTALAPLRDPTALKAALRPGQPLRKWILAAPPGWLEALSMQVPERFGVELLDAANWRLPERRRRIWLRAFLRGFPSRAPSSIGDRTRDLLREIQKLLPHHGYGPDDVLEALLAVAAIPEHPLNSAGVIHPWLWDLDMPVRDSSWTIPMYYGDLEGALGRLMNWAARGPHPGAGDDVVELAAIPLCWMLTSPNRPVRDSVTKALASLLRNEFVALTRVVRRFKGVNDPYVSERIAVIAHGALLNSVPAPDAADVCHALREWLEAETIPNILMRDGVRGAHEWAHRHGLVGTDELAAVGPPYGSLPPEMPPTQEEIEAKYERGGSADPNEERERGYAVLLHSLFFMGDFGRYVVEPDLREFSRIPFGEEIPPRRRATRTGEWDEAAIERFLDSLSAEELADLVADPEAFGASATDFRRFELRSLRRVRNEAHPDRHYPVQEGLRWIFCKVLDLGWTPERFDRFDRNIGRGQESHKPERIGKKYQWIALRELTARLADNYIFAGQFDDEPQVYRGPWQLRARDIDPSLPPAPGRLDEDGELVREQTFANEPADAWWIPAGPVFDPDDEIPDDWAARSDEEPTVESLVRSINPDGAHWIALSAHHGWEDPFESHRYDDETKRRILRFTVDTCLCKARERTSVLDQARAMAMDRRSLGEVPSFTNYAYLGEMPWTITLEGEIEGWRGLERYAFNEDEEGPRVLASTVGYWWEGHVLDCSIDDSVGCVLPCAELFAAGDLRWHPAHREWTNASGVAVARYVTADNHRVLLVREDWLREMLRQLEFDLVIDVTGERDLVVNGMDPRRPGGWTDLDSVGYWDGTTLDLPKFRRDFRMPAR
jgi:hypothetical protein